MTGFIDIVFDGPPSHESGRFVEVEDADGKSISIGEWVTRPGDPDGWAALRITTDAADAYALGASIERDGQDEEDDMRAHPFLNIDAMCANPEYDPRNPSAVALMVEAGFRDLVAAVGDAAHRNDDAIHAHAMELGRQRA